MNPVAKVTVRIAGLLALLAMLAGCGTAPPRTAEPGPLTVDGPRLATPPGWNPIGYSAQRRPLLVAQSGSGPLRIYLIGSVHGDETEGLAALEHVRRAANSGATIRMLRDLNPDGTASRSRFNARGVDLNRNWPASNFVPVANGGHAPLSEIETRVLAPDLRAFGPDIVVALHSTSSGEPFVNYDGPAAQLASAFAEAARRVDSGWHVRPDMGYPTTGSLGTYLGIDQNVPILTVEFRRGQHPGHARAALEQGLAAVISNAGPRPR